MKTAQKPLHRSKIFFRSIKKYVEKSVPLVEVPVKKNHNVKNNIGVSFPTLRHRN